jgi:hypothetical protein
MSQLKVSTKLAIIRREAEVHKKDSVKVIAEVIVAFDLEDMDHFLQKLITLQETDEQLDEKEELWNDTISNLLKLKKISSDRYL